MRIIQLTQGKVTMVDDEDYAELSKYKWQAQKDEYRYYASRKVGKDPHRRMIAMHREILCAPLGLHCDHINGDGLDNRRENLRLCTPSQNQHNRLPQGGTSAYKGVCFHKECKNWVAQITHNGKNNHLGRFDDEIDAALAYDQAARELFGEFARLNFKDERSV